MYDYIVKKHEMNRTWLMDIYIKFLAPVIIACQIYMDSWVSAAGILAVVCLMIPMRQMVRMRGRVPFDEAERIATGFHSWMKDHPDTDSKKGFDQWWINEDNWKP